MTSPPDVQNVPDVWQMLEQAREEIYARVPSKLIQVPDGEIFTPGPMGLSGVIGGIPKAGESAGYRTILNVTGNWSSGPGPWRVQHMLWADNPDYVRTWDLINRIDAALAQRERFVLVPKEPTAFQDYSMWEAWKINASMKGVYKTALAAAPRPEEKP